MTRTLFHFSFSYAPFPICKVSIYFSTDGWHCRIAAQESGLRARSRIRIMKVRILPVRLSHVADSRTVVTSRSEEMDRIPIARQ